ncbi:MAG: NGG1p interacting factor NIF3 [Clostridiales bacterium]|nr:NGG1p interacting factor NIF3 [Clostridiales bacterium]
MKLQEIYQLAIQMGIDADPRGVQIVQKELEKAQKAFSKLEEEDKGFFDQESLRNPYADSRVLNGDQDTEIHKIFCGVDIESGEVAVVDALNQRGAGIDLLLAHHPEGAALAALPDVMHLQSGYMASVGVRPNLAESLMDERIKEVRRSIGVTNHLRAVNSAQLLGLAFLCIHTPCDNLVNKYVGDYLAFEQPQTLDDLCKALRKIPEYHYSAMQCNPPHIVNGSGAHSVGKIMIDFTGGTGGHKDNMKALSEAGISTVVTMHISDKMLETAKKARLSVVIAGHIASDNIGLNLFLDRLEEAGLEIVAGSGLYRVNRTAES